MRPLREGEERLDLCAGYKVVGGDEASRALELQQQPRAEESQHDEIQSSNPTLKRPMDQTIPDEIVFKHPRLDQDSVLSVPANV
jgi:jumonji domain-containing protein 2